MTPYVTLKKLIEDTEMIDIPDEPVRCDAFFQMTEACVTKAQVVFERASMNAESYVMELINVLESNYEKEEMDKLKHSAKAEHNPVWFYNLTGYFCQRNTEAFVKSTRNSLDGLKLGFRLREQGAKVKTIRLSYRKSCLVVDLSGASMTLRHKFDKVAN